MNLYLKSILLVFLSFIGSVSSSYAQAKVQVKINRIIPLETIPGALLSGNLYFRSNSGYYVISDNNMLCIYSKAGKLHKLLRIKGRGPQESLTLKEFFVDENYLYINNRFLNSILIYDLNGRYIRTQKFDLPFGEFVVHHGKVIADISNLAYSENKRIGIFTLENGKLISREISMQPSPRYVEGGYNQFHYIQNKLYYLPYFSDQLYVFDGKAFSVCFQYPFTRNEIFRANAERLNNQEDHLMAWSKFLQEKQIPAYVKPVNNLHQILINYYIGKEKYITLIHTKTQQSITQKVEKENSPLLYEAPKLIEEDAFLGCIPAYLFTENFKKAASQHSIGEDDNPVLILYTLL